MREQDILMQLIGNLAVIAGAILGLIITKDTITGILGQRIVGGLKSATGRLGKAGKDKAMKGRLGEVKGAWDRGKQNRQFKRRAGEGMLANWGRDEARSGTKRGRLAAWVGTRQSALDRSALGRAMGGTRGAAMATQGIHKAFDEDVAAFKATMTSKDNDELLEIMGSDKYSEAQRSAAAGMIMGRDHRESHIKALKQTGAAMRAAEKSGDSREVARLSSIQKQMSADMRNKPFALGDQAAGQLQTGSYGRVMKDGDGNAIGQLGDIEEELRDRVGNKLSASSLANMNPDEMRRIYEDSSNGRLNEQQRANLVTAINDARKNKQINDLIKPQERAMHDAILAKANQDAAYSAYLDGGNIV